MIRVDATASREVRAVLLAIKQSETTLNKQLRRNVKDVIGPAFQEQIRANTLTRVEGRVLSATARVAVSNQNIRLSSATVGRPLSGGLTPKAQYGAVEFGAKPDVRTTYSQRSHRGKPYRLTRHTQRQLRPYNPKGYVFYPAVADIAPRYVALFVQTAVRTFAEAFEGKTSG